MKIDIPAFLQSLTGMVDCDSGYGAEKPVSPEARAFLLGRYGSCIVMAAHMIRFPSNSPECRPALAEFASDLREVADALDSVAKREDGK